MLINCAAYQDGRKLADIDIDSISDYVARPECFVWVALKDPSPDELAVMKDEFDLHELAIEDAQHGHQRPKIEEYGGSLFTVMHTVEMDEQGEFVIGEVDVFVGTNYVLSVRRGTRTGFQGVRARCEREPHLLKEGSAFVLYALIDDVVDRYFPVVEAMSTELETLEDRIFEKNDSAASRAIVQDLYTMKRRLVILQHHIVPLQEAVGKLTGGRIPAICAGMQAYFRDVYDHLDRIVRIIEGRREIVVTAVQVNLGMISLAESEITKRLGSFAALFAVPTMIAGIYGDELRAHSRAAFQVRLSGRAGRDAGDRLRAVPAFSQGRLAVARAPFDFLAVSLAARPIPGQHKRPVRRAACDAPASSTARTERGELATHCPDPSSALRRRGNCAPVHCNTAIR